MQNDYLQNEIRKLKIDKCLNKKNPKEETKKMSKILFFMLPVILATCNIVSGSILECPSCHKEISLQAHYYTTWNCPSCGYCNYEDISLCGVCGTQKPSRRNGRNIIDD